MDTKGVKLRGREKLMKALLGRYNPFQGTQEEDFDSIKIGIASPETIRSWSYDLPFTTIQPLAMMPFPA